MRNLIVMPPVRGLRHVVVAGAEKTLCGRRCELWEIDVKGGPASCRTCQRVLRNLRDSL